MQWKIELRYSYGWDDAAWTEETNGEIKPMRFGNAQAAEAALQELFSEVNAAVTAKDMDIQENPSDYRVVEANC